MALILDTPFFQLEGSSVPILSEIESSGDLSRRLITLKNTNVANSISFQLTLSQGGTGFSIIPGSLGGTAAAVLEPGQKISFAIDYSKGSSTTATLTCNQLVYSTYYDHSEWETPDPDGVVIGPVRPITFKVSGSETSTSRSLGPIFSRDGEGEYTIQQASSKITQDETSFGVIRTNPKLTGNIKITVDSSENIWLNSIDAEKELADDRFKKFKLSPDSSYVIDVNRFFDYGQTPAEIVYSLYEEDSAYITTKRSLHKQYDTFYHYGAEQLKSKFYEEDFSFFAPLYMKNEVPEYFLIFRTEGPLNEFTYRDSDSSTWASKVTSDILSKSQIVKAFDLSEKSAIGRYLRRIIDHPSRKEADITVSYQKQGYTTFNGISYAKGTFVESGELLYDYFSQENPLSSSEEFISLGFQRNKVLSSHLLNLEFLFDDDDAENYSINRYFGLYVNAVDLATFELSAEALTEFSFSEGQLPNPRKGVDGSKISQKSFTQTNPNGVRLYVDSDSIQSFPKLNKNIFTSEVDKISVGTSVTSVTLPGKIDDKISPGDLVKLYNISLEALFTVSSVTYTGETTLVEFLNASFQSTVPLSILPNYAWSLDFNSEGKLAAYEKRVFENKFIENTSRLFYVKDNKGFLNSVSSTKDKPYSLDSFTKKSSIEIKLKDKKVDISNFSGFTDILTQTEAKLLEKGKSSISLEVKDYFAPGDYIEISWEPGPTSGGYPLRWRVVANDTAILPGEIWPVYDVHSDSQGEYYVSYFHKGDSSIKLEKFVKSIEDAFNLMISKNFEVLAKGTNLYFKSTQEGKFSESAILKFSTVSTGKLNILGVPCDTSGSVKFLGGSDRNRTRARISREVAQGILPEEYLSTHGSYSKVREYDVLGNTVLFSPYLEEPVYDETGEKLIDFRGVEDYRVVSLSEEISEIQLTSDKKITTYQLYRPSFGILSIMPLRDFDTDYYESDYSRSYIVELIKYFSRDYQPLKVASVSGTTYTFEKNHSFDSYPVTLPFLKLFTDGSQDPVLFNSKGKLRFNAPGNTAELIISPSNVVSENPVAGDTVLPMTDLKQLYFTEDLLSKFKGFLTLSGITTSEDELNFQVLENLWDPSRFNPEIRSEYDRYSENFLKSLVLRSRVVPYAMKWVSPQGRDVRDNPYRFNYHRVFGNMGFSPSEISEGPDPIFFTHEWPYIDSVPSDFPVDKYPEYAFSYFFDKLTGKYDFSSMKRDWFTQYFSTGYPVEKAKTDSGAFSSMKIEPTEKYSFFNVENFSDKTFTFFRGYKLQIAEKNQQSGEINYTSKKYNNYRFSVIMKTVEENPLSLENPVEFKTVVNEKFKFIVVVITIRTSSYRFPLGNLRYVDLYTLQNSNDVAKYHLPHVSGYPLGEFYQTVPSDKKLSYSINIENNSIDPSILSAADYYDAYSSDEIYIDNLANQIVPLTTGDYSDMVAIFATPGLQSLANLPKPKGVYDFNTVQFSNLTGYIKQKSLLNVSTIGIPYSTISWEAYSFYHQMGGANTLQDITGRVSFSEIIRIMKGTSTKGTMQYEIYAADGSFSSIPNFIIDTVSPESIERIYDFFPISDTDKPSQFFETNSIGASLVEQKDLQTIYRYQGDFSPKFKDVLKFWLREDEEFTNISSRDFLFNNTHIGEELPGFSVLKNQFYSKVADSEILTLSPESGYSPVYPLVNEISIDKKNIFVWNSNWDQNYYRKYSNTSTYSEVKGTEDMKEFKSFMGSKLMKVPDQFDLYQFNVVKLNYVDELSTTTEEFAYVDTGSSIILQVNSYNRLLREMKGDSSEIRAAKEFLKLSSSLPASLDPSLVDLKTEEYLKANILDLYQISDVSLYVLQTGNSADGSVATLKNIQGIEDRPVVEYSSSPNGVVTLSEKELISRKYVSRKDAKLTTLDNLKFQITYPVDSRFYTSLSIGVKVTRI